jgi:hypothetical protein
VDLFIRPLLFALYSILQIVSWSSTFRASQEYKDRARHSVLWIAEALYNTGDGSGNIPGAALNESSQARTIPVGPR